MKQQKRISITVLMIWFMVFAIIPSFFIIPSSIQTTATPDSIGFQELEPKTSQFVPRSIRVAIYNEPNVSMPSYGDGGIENNLTDTITILTNAGYQVTNITTQEIYDHKLKTAEYDIFVMVDNLPKTNITNYVKEFWLGGGGLLSFDTAISFLCYAGVLPSESEGDNGRSTYWEYVGGTHNIYQRHPVSKNYSSGDLFTSLSTRAAFDWAVMLTTSIAADIVRIATIDGSINDVTVLGFDPSSGGGRVVQLPWPNGVISSNMADLVSDAVDWLCPRPKGRILFDLSHAPYYGIDSWDSTYVTSGSKYGKWRNNLVARSFTIDKLYPSVSGNLTSVNLASYDLLIEVNPDLNFSAPEVAVVSTWVNDGGSIIALGDNPHATLVDNSQNLNYLLSNFDFEMNLSTHGIGIMDYMVTHPTTESCTDLSFGAPGLINYSGDAYPIWGNDAKNIGVAAQEYGKGRVILASDMNFLEDTYIVSNDNLQFGVNIVNWLTASQADILIYVDEKLGNPDPNDNYYRGPVATSLNDLGLNFYLTFTKDYFNLSLALYNFNLVIVDNAYANFLNILGYYSEILDYVKAGGYLILSTWDYSVSDQLWDYLGFSYAGNNFVSAPSIYIWDSGHPIFNNPALYSANSINSTWDYVGIDCSNLTLHSNATAVAGLSNTISNDGAAIILGANGRAITNAMLLTVYYNDTDNSTYPDALEIWENEIAFLQNQSLSIEINEPDNSDIFGSIPPSFDLTIQGIGAVDMWYTLNNGVNHDIASTTATINQAAWDALPEGTVSLKFYVENSNGDQRFKEVTIVKDSQAPSITIVNPIINQVFGSTAPSFIVEIFDTHLDQMWYTLGSTSTKHFFTTNSSIVQSAWDVLAQGTVTITFYANDTIGHENSASVNIIKNVPPLSGTLGTPGIPGYNFYVIVGLVGTISIIIIRRRQKKSTSINKY